MKMITIARIKEKVLEFLKTAGRITLILISVFLGFASGEIYRGYLRGVASSKMPQVQMIKQTSVAINDRGELMIIDRESGKYLLFSDSVGQSIFHQYASRIYVQKQNITN